MNTLNDSQGNCILIEKGSSGFKGFDIYMRLTTERHRRHIGRISNEHRTMLTERISTKHILTKANAYGFNYHILSNAKKFDKILLYEADLHHLYMLEIKYMLSEGSFLFFKQQGFEKQIFLTREWISHYQIHKPEDKTMWLKRFQISNI